MITKNEKLRKMQELDEKLAKAKDQRSALMEEKAILKEEPLWEDTLKGQILEEENKVQEKLYNLINTLSQKTGKRYDFSFKEFVLEKEITTFAQINTTDFQELTGSQCPGQKDLIEAVVRYCAKHKCWRTSDQLKTWIRRVISQTKVDV